MARKQVRLGAHFKCTAGARVQDGKLNGAPRRKRRACNTARALVFRSMPSGGSVGTSAPTIRSLELPRDDWCLPKRRFDTYGPSFCVSTPIVVMTHSREIISCAGYPRAKPRADDAGRRSQRPGGTTNSPRASESRTSQPGPARPVRADHPTAHRTRPRAPVVAPGCGRVDGRARCPHRDSNVGEPTLACWM